MLYPNKYDPPDATVPAPENRGVDTVVVVVAVEALPALLENR
jgi:hypothetical protein